MKLTKFLSAAFLAAAALSSIAIAQPAGMGGPAGFRVVSPEVSQDGTVTFRIFAPKAEKVQFLDDDTDITPYVEKNYRTINDRQHRAIAGLSMGGFQTLDIAFRHLDGFSAIGVFSSGAVLGRGRRGPAPRRVRRPRQIRPQPPRKHGRPRI